MKFIVYKITDGKMFYIGSTVKSLAQRKAQHHMAFKNQNIHWKLYEYWRNVGWENMQMEAIKTNIVNKISMKQIEEENIKLVLPETRLNVIKAYCPDYEATRSINSGIGEIETIEMKRKNRRDCYARKKNDIEWHTKMNDKNRERMRIKRENLEYKQKEAEKKKKQLFVNVDQKLL